MTSRRDRFFIARGGLAASRVGHEDCRAYITRRRRQLLLRDGVYYCLTLRSAYPPPRAIVSSLFIFFSFDFILIGFPVTAGVVHGGASALRAATGRRRRRRDRSLASTSSCRARLPLSHRLSLERARRRVISFYFGRSAAAAAVVVVNRYQSSRGGDTVACAFVLFTFPRRRRGPPRRFANAPPR